MPGVNNGMRVLDGEHVQIPCDFNNGSDADETTAAMATKKVDLRFTMKIKKTVMSLGLMTMITFKSWRRMLPIIVIRMLVVKVGDNDGDNLVVVVDYGDDNDNDDEE